MNIIYKDQNIELSIEFEDANAPENVFGNLKLFFQDELVSSMETESLGYFYVDCDRFVDILESQNNIDNQLFELSDADLLQHYSSWLNHSIEDEETSTVRFFDSNYFLTGSQFTSYFFDHIMIMYTLKNSFIHFKFWKKENPENVRSFTVSTDSLLSSFRLFMKAFDKHVKRDSSE